MARKGDRLSAVTAKNVTAAGYYHDGGGLYLQVTPTGGKSWVYRFMLNRNPRMMGFGPFPTMTLADARGKATAARRQLLDGVDPIEARKADRLPAKLDQARSITFSQCAIACVEAMRAGWKNEKHAEQWDNTL